MVQAVNQRGRSPRSPLGQPHARRYLQCSFLGSLGISSHSVIAANHCTTVRVNTMTANTDLKCVVSLLCPLQLRNGRAQILATMCPNSSDTWSKWDIIYLKKCENQDSGPLRGAWTWEYLQREHKCSNTGLNQHPCVGWQSCTVTSILNRLVW